MQNQEDALHSQLQKLVEQINDLQLPNKYPHHRYKNKQNHALIMNFVIWEKIE